MIIGLFAKSTIGLGTVSVKGRRRVPKPPTRMRAFSPTGDPLVATIFAGCGELSRGDIFGYVAIASKVLHWQTQPHGQVPALLADCPRQQLDQPIEPVVDLTSREAT